MIPAKVCSPLGEFVAKWVATTMPLLSIIGQVMTQAYIETAVPVFSSRSFKHFTLVKNGPLMVGGKKVACIGECQGGYSTKVESRSRTIVKWRVMCQVCKFYATYTLPDDSKVLEYDKEDIMPVANTTYIRTIFPIPIKRLEW